MAPRRQQPEASCVEQAVPKHEGAAAPGGVAGRTEVTPPDAAVDVAGGAPAAAKAEAAAGAVRLVGGQAVADEAGGEVLQELRRCLLDDASSESDGSGDEASPPEHGSVPPEDVSQEEDDGIWYLPPESEWEMYWDEANGCVAFYDNLFGAKTWDISQTDAFKAKPNTDVGKAVRIDTRSRSSCAGVAATLATPNDVDPEPELGTGRKYKVFTNSQRKLSFKMSLCDEEVLTRSASEIVLFGWDKSRQWRRCWTPRMGYAHVGRLHADALQRWKVQNAPWLPLEPLAMAAAEDDDELLRELLAAGHSPHSCSCEWTPLRYAAEAGSANCCVYLMHAGARDVEAKLVALTPFLKAMLMALEGVDDESVNFQQMDEQIKLLKHGTSELVDRMLEELAEAKKRQRELAAEKQVQAEKKQVQAEHDQFCQLLKAKQLLAEEEKKNNWRRKMLQREEEEELIHQRLEQENVRRRAQNRILEQEAQVEAEERRARLEAEEAEAERRRAEEVRREKEEEETAECIKRLQEAARRFDLMQQYEEEKARQKMELKQKLLQERLEAAREVRAQEEQEEQRIREQRERRQLEKERKAQERRRQLEEEEAKELYRQRQLEELDSLFCEQKAAAWTCMECGEDSVFHPDCPGSCMFCGTPQHQGHIAKTWEGWQWGPGGVMTRLE